MPCDGPYDLTFKSKAAQALFPGQGTLVIALDDEEIDFFSGLLDQRVAEIEADEAGIRRRPA